MIVFGPWVWRDTGAGYAWTAPPDTVAGIDLRSISAHAQPGGPPQGIGIFEVTTNPGSGYIRLADSTTGVVPRPAVIALRAALGISLSILPAWRFDNLLWEILTEHGDPTGALLAPPLMPTAAGDLELHFGDLLRRTRLDVGEPEWRLVQATFQHSYRTIRAEVLAGLLPPDHHRKVLTTFLRTMRTSDYHLFIPPDLPDETPLDPSTVLTDDFNRTSGAIGSSAEGWAWNAISGTWTITTSTGQVCRCPSLEAFCRAESDLSSANNTAQTTMRKSGSAAFSGVIARFSGSVGTGQGYIGFGSPSTGDCRISTLTAGVRSDLVTTGSGGTYNAGSILKISANGSSLVYSIDGTPVKSVTDTTFSTGLRTGMWGYGGDDRTFFKGEDIASLSPITGSLTTTLADLTVLGSGVVADRIGTLSATLDTLTTAPATGTVKVTGATPAILLFPLVVNPLGTGTVSITGTLPSQTLGLLTVLGTGTVGLSPITASLTATLATLTTAPATATVAITGTLPTATLGTLTLLATGTVANPPVLGVLSTTLAPLIVSASSATVAITGTLVPPLGTLTLAAFGTISTGPPMEGTLTATLAPLTLHAAATRAPIPVCLHSTLADLLVLMAQRWDGVVFWTDEEARLALNEALREWNLLTGTWRTQITVGLLIGQPEVSLRRVMTYGMRVTYLPLYGEANPARPLHPTSLAELNLGRPSWRVETTASGGDVPTRPILWAPLSLTRIAVWPASATNHPGALFIEGVLQTPVFFSLTALTQEIDLNEEIVDYIVDMALHIVAFKEGGARWRATRPYFEAFLQAAADENSVLKTNQRYRRFAGLDRRRDLQPSTGDANQIQGVATQFSRHDQPPGGGQ